MAKKRMHMPTKEEQLAMRDRLDQRAAEGDEQDLAAMFGQAPATPQAQELGAIVKEAQDAYRRLVQVLARLPLALSHAHKSAQAAHKRADAYKQVAAEAQAALQREQLARVDDRRRIDELEQRLEAAGEQVRQLQAQRAADRY